jgi:dihydrodipicolinate synthase/N-acetylneuraminate lyase
VEWLRNELDGVPFHAAMKEVLAARGVPIRPDVRAPLRALARDERRRVHDVIEAFGRAGPAARPA